MSFTYQPGAGGGGNTGAGARIAEAFLSFADQQNQVTNAGKAADYARKAMGDGAASQMGIADEEWKNLGNRDKAMAWKGFQDKQVMTEAMQKMKEFADVHQEKQDEAGALSRWASDMDRQLSPPTDSLTGGPMVANADQASLLQQFSPAQRANIHSLSTIGATNPRAVAALLNNPMFKQMSEPDSGTFDVDSTSVPGVALTRMRGSKQWQGFPTSDRVGELASAKATAVAGAKADVEKTGKFPKGTTFPKGVLTATYPNGTVDVVGHENGQAALLATILGGGGTAPAEDKPAAKANEVIRVTGDGKRAVFDADTKKFLRYAE